jgi:hypothetical protein
VPEFGIGLTRRPAGNQLGGRARVAPTGCTPRLWPLDRRSVMPEILILTGDAAEFAGSEVSLPAAAERGLRGSHRRALDQELRFVGHDFVDG